MTIAKTVRRVQYAGNGSTTPFAFAYRFFDDADLEVYITVDATGVQTQQTLTTHYTVSNNGDETGGTVTMVTAPASGETLTILGAVPLTQSTDYTGNDPFPAETHETALDRLTLQVQELQERLDRALKVQESDATTTTLPSTIDRAGKYAAFDGSGNIIATSGTSSDITVSTFMETVLDDTSGDAALTTLGAGTKGLAILKDTTSAAVLTELGVTAYAQTLLDDATAAATRTTLGLGSAAVAGLLDEDDMSSDSATDVPSQQSVKAYVDDAVIPAANAVSDIGFFQVASGYSGGFPIAKGDSIAGANLVPAEMWIGAGDSVDGDVSGASAPSGTWRALNQAVNDDTFGGYLIAQRIV